MKKFLTAAVLAVTFLLAENSVHAMPVQLFDYNVDYIISDLRMAGRELGFEIWGTEYYTWQGARRCELHFGRSDDNVIRFRLNDGNSVSRALVTIFNKEISRATMEAANQAGLIAGVILISIGLTPSEVESLINETADDFYDAQNKNPNMTHYHEKHSIWCSKTRRYIVADYEVTTSSVDFYIYAHD